MAVAPRPRLPVFLLEVSLEESARVAQASGADVYYSRAARPRDFKSRDFGSALHLRLRTFHDRVEAGYGTGGRWLVRHRWLVLFLAIAITAALASQLPNLRSDNSAESFLRADDPARIGYDRFRAQFGQDDFIVIAVNPPEVFDLAFLEWLREFHRAIEREVPHLDDVKSLLNARNTRGEGDRLIVEDLLERWPESDADLMALRARVLENPLYVNTLVNAEATVTTLTLEPVLYSTLGPEMDALAGFEEEDADAELALLTDAEASEMVDTLEALVERFRTPEIDLYMSGGFVGNHHSTRMMMRDIQIFLPVNIAVIGVFLFILFRRIGAVVLPLLAVLCSQVATFGVMALLDIPASISSQIIPILLLTVGVCGTIHLLTLVYRKIDEGAEMEDAVAFALAHSGLAITMASLTTAAGLVSFATAPLAQVGNLGIVAPIGVMLSLLYVIALLPALLAIFPARKSSRPRAAHLQATLGNALARLGSFAARRAWLVVGASAVIVAIGAVGVSQLRFSQFPMNWFPKDDPMRLAAEFIDRELRGANTLEVIIDTGRENGLHDPEVMRRIERAMQAAVQYDDGEIYVAKALSIVDVAKETHKALNENRHAFYTIPGERELLAQELLLFENSGSEDLEKFTDTTFRLARVSLRLPMADDMHFPVMVAAIEEEFREAMGDGIRVETTGLGTLFARTFSAINVTMARSYLLAFVIITPLMVLLIGNLRQGLVAMIPNLLPIFLTLGLMGATGIALDNSTLLVGCIIIGLAVDDTIHFMHKFQRYYSQSGDPELAVRRTLETTGSALLFTSLVLTSGFLVMTLAYMRNIFDFAILAAFATTVAFLADVVLAPALMVLISPHRSAADERSASSPLRVSTAP